MRQVELDHGSGSNEPFVMKQPERKETPPSSTAPSLIQLQLKTLVVLLAMALGIGRYLVPLQHQRHSGTAVVSPAESTETGQPQDKAEPTMISWVRHTRPFSDPVKVVLSPNWYWADVKCAAKQEMAPSSLDTVSPGDIWLLHPRQGRLPMTKQCIDAEQEDHDDLSSTLIVIFVNNAESRADLKQRTSIPIKIASSLCLQNEQAYQTLYKILLSDHFTSEDVRTLRRSLCPSSIDGSTEYVHTPPTYEDSSRVRSAYNYVFHRKQETW